MRSVSFRTRVLLVVLVVSIAPFMLLGAWLSQATLRGGEALLRDRLAATLEREAAAIAGAWVPIRSALLDLAGSASVAAACQEAHPALPAALDQALAALDRAVESLSFYDAKGLPVGVLERPEEARVRRTYVLGGPLTVELPVEESPGVRVGTMAARLSFDALRIHAPPPATAGAVIVAFDPGSGDPLLPTPFDSELARRERFEWNGEDWVVEYHALTEPGIVLAAAAPRALFTQPFLESAREGLVLLVLVAAGGLVATALLTRRMTASLRRLAEAAAAVAGGNLEGTTGVESEDEVGRVANAFDTMTRSLRHTLTELSERSSLAAVGEFATALAHEVRNPLTSIKLDLQEVEESLAPGSSQQMLQASAIEGINRLDRTVGGALAIARSGRIEKTTVDLVGIVRMAARNARGTFEERDAVLETPSENTPPIELMADPDALVGALLNLLRNAAQALPPGGRAAIEVDRVEGEAIVRVHDEGSGIAPENLERIFTPFFTTGSGGTGLGLAVAQRVVVAHGGEIEVESELSRGTVVSVRLPTDTGTTRSGHS